MDMTIRAFQLNHFANWICNQSDGYLSSCVDLGLTWDWNSIPNLLSYFSYSQLPIKILNATYFLEKNSIIGCEDWNSVVYSLHWCPMNWMQSDMKYLTFNYIQYIQCIHQSTLFARFWFCILNCCPMSIFFCDSK